MDPHIIVRKAYDDGLDNMQCRRAMVSVKMEMWAELKKLCGEMTFLEARDKLYWLLTDSGQYTTKSFYLALQNFALSRTNFCGKLKSPCELKPFSGWCSREAY
jgi:hypothetical protein